MWQVSGDDQSPAEYFDASGVIVLHDDWAPFVNGECTPRIGTEPAKVLRPRALIAVQVSGAGQHDRAEGDLAGSNRGD